MAHGQEARPGLQLSTFQVNTRPLAVGAALLGAGVVIGLAGLAVSGAALAVATRRWIDQLDTPPSELARQKWAQARAATAAGTSAWQNGVTASAHSS
jgi:membrane protein implicated in regulation of membrane protease activity